MSEVPNPFAKPVKKSENHAKQTTLLWIMAIAFITSLMVLTMLWSNNKQLHQKNESLRNAWSSVTNELSASGNLLTSIQRTNEELRARVSDLEKEKDQTVRSARSLEDQMRAELESKDVTISKLQGRLTVNILDRILFDSGEAVLKTDGEAVLQKIASILKQHPELKIHVIGHTDNVPIRSTARSRFASNWELSTERALAAVRFLTERAGVAPQRLGAVGYGEFRPIADNSTIEGRARNRRIAITILPDELVGAEPGSPATNGIPAVTTSNLPASD